MTMTTTRVILSFPWSNEKLSKGDYFQDTGVTDAVMKIARKELREDKSIREQSLQQLREWLQKNTDVENVRTDDVFLLRFLRSKKFSLPMTQQMILKYLNYKKVLSHLINNLDYLSPSLNRLISSGYVLPSPIKDKNGRRIVIASAKYFNPDLYDSTDMARAHFLTYETILEDPAAQILGVIHIGDFKGTSAAQIARWNPTDFLRLIKWGEQSLPMRHKEIHLVNVPTAVKYIIDAGKSMVSKKMKDRLSVHVTVNELHKKVDPACLPKELGGNMPIEEMVEIWKEELASKRTQLIALDNMKIISDRGILSRNGTDKNNNASGMESMTGSFRKLEVD